MDLSYGDDFSGDCEHCGNSVEAPVWVIVDASHRPDLLEGLIMQETNTYRCASCQHVGVFPHAVVISRALEGHEVIITHPGDHLSDDAGGLAFYWVTVLGEGLGKPADWLDHLVQTGLPIIPRTRLAAALRPTPRPAARATIEAAAKFVASRTWVDAYDAVSEHPELLAEEADHLLDSSAVRLAKNGPLGAADMMLLRRDFLRSARQLGLDRALLDVTGATIQELRADVGSIDPTAVILGPAMRGAGLDPLDARQLQRFVRTVDSAMRAAGLDWRAPEQLEKFLVEHPELGHKNPSARNH